MGQTLKQLAVRPVPEHTVFDKRCVVEVCEVMHVHYRNLRLLLSTKDWISFAKGMANALKRWEAQGSPEPKPGTHIELCRVAVAEDPLGNQTIQVNLNRNLYPQHEGRIFAEGANFDEPDYVHLKIRDIRLELSRSDFHQLALAVAEAQGKLEEDACQTVSR